MKTINPKKCPEDYLLEAFIEGELSSSERELILHHLKSCNKCRMIYSELEKFYQLYRNEIQKPVASSIFSLADKIDPDKYKIAGIILDPLKNKQSADIKQYRSELIASNFNQEKMPIEDMDCIDVAENQIFLRAIQSKEDQHSILYLFAHITSLYQSIYLQIDIIQKKFKSDGIGTIDFGTHNIEKLDNRIMTIDRSGRGK